MTPARKRRLYWVLGILAGVGIAGALALSAFQKNVMFFFDPTQVAAGEVKQGQRFRLDIDGDSIDDAALADALVRDLRLLMVESVVVFNKTIVEEPHKRSAL